MKRNSRPREGRVLLAEDFEDVFAVSRNKSIDRKTHQLCAQAQRSLAFLLEAECSDGDLQGLTVESVSPHPNASRLLVVLRQWDRSRILDFSAILKRLAEIKGYLRSELGTAINRKKTPDLVFEVLLEGASP